MGKIVGRAIFKLLGWKIKIEGDLSKLDRCILVMAPHTSNWDYFLGLLTYLTLGKKLKIIIKDTHTRAFYGKLIKKIGAIGVDRSQKNDLVKIVAEKFNKENFSLVITPEGSRSYVKKWKMGFYHMALAANVPVILASGDYKNKIVRIGHQVKDIKTRSRESIMAEIEDYFKDVQGKHPRQYNPKIY